jgi:site-specific DNA-methyltransferase (adenine-specific)
MKLILGDCLEVMKTISDKSVDLILVDLPYGTTNCKWDLVIPFEPMWAEIERIRKDKAAVVMFAQTPFDKELGHSNIKNLKYEWIWEKTQATGHFNAKKAPMKAHENVLVFYPHNFYPIKTENHKPVNTYTKRKEVVNKSSIYGKVKEDISGGGETDRYPRSVQVFKSDKQKSSLHPTQKPVGLLEYLVKTYTVEGETVLDFTMGSGSTGVACKNLNREFIGIEKDEKYFNIAKERLGSNCEK